MSVSVSSKIEWTLVKGDHMDCQLLTIMADVIAMSFNIVSGRCYSHVT